MAIARDSVEKSFSSAIALLRLSDRVPFLRMQFACAAPMKHVVIDGFFVEEIARKAAASFPAYDGMERVRDSVVEKRASESRLDRVDPIFTTIFDALRSAEFVSLLAAISGIDTLSPSETMDGAGLHQVRDGGFHNVHADKNRDPVRGYYHRLSLIVYLNDGWRIGTPGALELWDRNLARCVEKVEPVFNRCVVFAVGDRAYHGYGRLSLPAGESRKSLAMWYLSPQPGPDQATTPREVKFALRSTDTIGVRLQHLARRRSLLLPDALRQKLKRSSIVERLAKRD